MPGASAFPQQGILTAVLRLLSVALGGCAVGCSPDEDPAPGPSPDQRRAAEIDRLRSLPYLESCESPAVPGQDGVVLYDPDRSYPGYTLYNDWSLRAVCLIDAIGDVVHAWEYPPDGRLTYRELLPNGDLLAVARDEPLVDKARYVVRYSWEGRVLWKRKLAAHHDLEVTPRGQILTLICRPRRIPAVDPDIDVRDHWLALLSHDGDLLEYLPFYDLFSARPDIMPLQEVAAHQKEGKRHIDLFHPNSLEWMHQPHLAATHPLYSLSNVLVCMRHQDAIAVIDWDNRELVWAWGQGEVSGPHDATVLKNGHILLFDNGLGRGWSRVIELDPLTRQIVWEYRAPQPADFYTVVHGSNQRLPNGNTLIANSGHGEVFEVTPEGEIVWRFFNPDRKESGRRASVGRVTRHELAYVDQIRRNFAPSSGTAP